MGITPTAKKQWESFSNAELNDFILATLNAFREETFPFPSATFLEKLAALEKLDQHDYKLSFKHPIIYRSSLGIDLLQIYFPNYWSLFKEGFIAPIDVFADDEKLQKIIRDCVRYKLKITNETIRDLIFRSPDVRQPEIFPPTTAAVIYSYVADLLCQNDMDVWDMSAGFGGRCLGAWMSKRVRYYQTTEPEQWIFNGDLKLITDLLSVSKTADGRAKYRIDKAGSEKFTLASGSIDFCFAAFPSHRDEYYQVRGDTSDDRQSDVLYPIYGQWLKRYIYPSLKTAYTGLRKGGILALYRPNTKTTPTLEEDCIRLALDFFDLEDILKVTKTVVPPGKKVRQSKLNNIFLFRKEEE